VTTAAQALLALVRRAPRAVEDLASACHSLPRSAVLSAIAELEAARLVRVGPEGVEAVAAR
jgi:hypothetical protein